MASNEVCPTCEGTGVLPKGRKSDLVALIPYGDNRLKPSRTKWYVGFTIVFFLVLGALLCFFLIPRAVGIKVFGMQITNKTLPKDNSSIVFQIKVGIELSNGNFYSAKAKDISTTVTRLSSEDIIATQSFPSVSLGIRADKRVKHYMTLNFTAEKHGAYVRSLCTGKVFDGNLYLAFSTSCSFEYLVSYKDESTSVSSFYKSCRDV
jgi:hypothetical protein